MEKYLIWNNKGGTGKTSLSFQIICQYANDNPDKKLLVIDVCPQANLSELFLGGLNQGGSDNLFKRQKCSPRATIGGYFQLRLPNPYNVPDFNANDFLTKPSDYNSFIPTNIDLFCGDPLLELQSNAMSTLANNQIPGTNTWLSIIDWLNDFIEKIADSYDCLFIDSNPSFSMYTQIAIAACSKIILPVMADDSSRRAIQNAFSLIYGLELPSDIYKQYAFAQKLEDAGRKMPKVHLIIKNRLTQYMGPASAYAIVLTGIDQVIDQLLQTNPAIFTFVNLREGIINVRDFQTTGVVSNARGCPLYRLSSGRTNILGESVQIKEEYRLNCVNNIREITKHL